MVILSLFDGMSCGQIALQELGVKIDAYFLSEIDNAAINQTRLNFPNSDFLGDVRTVEPKLMPKIDLVIGGSPCQGFSFAGKQLNFRHPKSRLFFEYVRVLKEVQKKNPDALFLLENVPMRRRYLRVITEYLGVFPQKINSNTVSAQHRERWYWTNIRTRPYGLFADPFVDIPNPDDKGITVDDILESERVVPDHCYKFAQKYRKLIPDGILFDGTRVLRKARSENARAERRRTGTNKYRDIVLLPRPDRKANTLVTQPDFQQLVAPGGNLDALRLLTTTEMSRLQTIPEWYQWDAPEYKIHQMLGNGWTVDIIKHILSQIQ